MSDIINEKLIEKLNSLLVDDVKNLSKCEELSKSYTSKKEEIEEKLRSLSSEGLEMASYIESCKTIDKTCTDIDGLLQKIQAQNALTEPMSVSLKVYFDKIDALEHLSMYLCTLEKVNEISDFIEFSLSVPDMEWALSEYKTLCGLCLHLIHSKCKHLSKFMIETTQYWNIVLKKQLSDEFDVAMKNVQWPHVSSNTLRAAPPPDAITKFQVAVTNLLKIELPSELAEKPVVTSSLALNFPRLSLPVHLMIQPLRKRFLYHFSSARQTNRIDKPEWYFTQVLTWISDHETVILQLVQPVYKQLQIKKASNVELMSGLVELAVEKLQRDLEQVMFDDALFSHTIDEALGFERELRDSHSYPQTSPSASSVLTQAQIFVKWIHMERKFARYKMDEMLASETAWCTVSPEDKVTEVAHTFLAMLSGMTDRYATLLQPGHKLQFVDLQLELTDDLRESLLQVLHSERSDPLNSKLPDVLNTVAYLISSLQQWDINPSMLLLEYYKAQHCVGEDDGEGEGGQKEGGIFGGALSLLNKLKEQLLSELSGAVMLEVKARSRPYRRDKWYAMTEEDLEVGNVTPSGCAMYQALADKLHLMEKRLAPELFTQLWQSVAQQLVVFILEELVLENSFNPMGGRVLEHDIAKCLVPLFRIYTRHPIAYFSVVQEACSILALPEISHPIKKAALTGLNQEVFSTLPLDLKQLNNNQIALTLRRRTDVAPEIM